MSDFFPLFGQSAVVAIEIANTLAHIGVLGFIAICASLLIGGGATGAFLLDHMGHCDTDLPFRRALILMRSWNDDRERKKQTDR
ncbi:MAG: hypothetical protein GY877_11255 [Hyphomicrobium sp.]|nr:hypothetical protein [Hyphomicrobium sp.]